MRHPGNQVSTVLAEGSCPKGFGMLIRDEMAGIEGRAAEAAARLPISRSSLPTLLLGELLLLIGP
jgi:hypothetical protein